MLFVTLDLTDMFAMSKWPPRVPVASCGVLLPLLLATLVSTHPSHYRFVCFVASFALYAVSVSITLLLYLDPNFQVSPESAFSPFW